MKFKFGMIYVIVLCIWFASEMLCAKKSNIHKRLEAIEQLVRVEMYFVHDKIETDRAEREKLMKILNETLEYTDRSAINTANITQQQDDSEGKKADLTELTAKVEQNSETIKELSETLIRTDRGLKAEKKSRKADANDLTAQLLNIAETQNDLVKHQYNSLQNQNAILKSLSDMALNETLMMQNHENLVSLMINRTDVLQNSIDILGKKTALLEKRLETQEEEFASLRVSQTRLGQRNNDTQYLFLEAHNTLGEIKAEAEEIKQAVTSTLYCGNTLDLDSCIQRHFTDVHMNILSVAKVTVKLVDGGSSYKGRVEISYQGVYGTVCNDYWDEKDAQVACRMLGYTGGIAVVDNEFGPGTGDILFDDVVCQGYETSLFSCHHNGIGNHNCDHVEDAGVICRP